MTTLAKSTIRRAARPFHRFGLADLFALARQRKELGRLDRDMLKDLGLSAEEAEAESRRRFWDVPVHWRA